MPITNEDIFRYIGSLYPGAGLAVEQAGDLAQKTQNVFQRTKAGQSLGRAVYEEGLPNVSAVFPFSKERVEPERFERGVENLLLQAATLAIPGPKGEVAAEAGALRSLIARGGKNYPELRLTTPVAQSDYKNILADKVYRKTIADEVRPLLPKEIRFRDPVQQIDAAVNFFRDNKIAHHQMASKYPWYQRATKQYEGYNIRGHDLAKEFGHPVQRILVGESGLSPQTPPDQSFSMIERLMKVMRDGGDTRWDARFDKAIKDKQIPIEPWFYDDLRGKTYNELNNLEGYTPQEKAHLKAMWARTYDQAFHSPEYRTVTPEGKLGEIATGKGGKPIDIAWRGYAQIAKGIRALEGEAPEKLLTKAKISNYYNSKIAPNFAFRDWVADTHDIGSSFLSPVTSDTTEVGTSFGGPENKALGHHGLSALHIEAGNRAAAKLGMIPSDLQAGIWSHQQGFMSADALPAKAVAEIRKVWKDAGRGKYTVKQARAEAIRIAKEAIGKSGDPTWARKPTGRHGAIDVTKGNPADTGELYSGGGIIRAAGSRVGSGVAGGIPSYQEGGEVAEPDAPIAPAGLSISDFLEQPSGFTARATGYHPVDPGDPNYAMEGGRFGAEQWHGQNLDQEPLYTLDQFSRGEAPYVSVAMDNTTQNPYPYGTFLASPQFPGVKFRMMDTGSAFRGRGTSRIDIARDNAAGANAEENNRDLDFYEIPADHDFGEQVRSRIAGTPQRALLAGTPTGASVNDFLDSPQQPQIDQYLDGDTTGEAVAHGLIHGGAGVATGWALATAGDATGFNEVLSAMTGPLAPITFGGLNMLEFLGGSLIGAKGIDTAEKALERYVPAITEMKNAAKEHPVADQVASNIPMLPFAWKSAKGYYNLAKAAEGVGEAAQVITMRAGGGAAAGLGLEAVRPHVENAFNAVGEKLGFTPDEVKEPTIRSFLENAAIGAALNGMFGARALRDTTVDPREGGDLNAKEPDKATGPISIVQRLPAVSEAEGEVQEGDPRYETAPGKRETVTGKTDRLLNNVLTSTFVRTPTAPGAPPKVGPFGAGKRLIQSAFGRWLGTWSTARQNSNFWSSQLARHLLDVAPNKNRRIAMYNWAQAGGDEAVLRDHAARAPNDLKKGYEDALTLSDKEKAIARSIRDAFDKFLERGRQTGMLNSAVEDYLKRIVIKRPEIADEDLKGAFTPSAKLRTSFPEARQRFWETMVDAERQGIRYDKDIARSLYEYARSFSRASIDRTSKRQLFDLETANGRPLFITSGRGEMIGQEEKNPSLLVTPYGVRQIRGQAAEAARLQKLHPNWSEEKANAIAKEKILQEYERVDAPSLRNWQWVQTLEDGTSVLMQGDVLVHKSIAEQVRNKFGTQRPDPWLSAFAKVQGFIKGSKLSLTLFHDVHERVNAAGHLVNSFAIRPMEDLNANPEIQAAMRNGLALHARDQDGAFFAEGMAAHGWPEMVPGLGKYVRAYKDVMFEDWIPRYKAEMYLKALERNRARYPKLNEEQLATLTARQSNATFGEQNYMMMMGKITSNPRFWKQMQALFLAPDFGVSKLQHIGQAFTPYGGEQRMGLGLVAAGLYTGARFLNSVLSDNGDPHWEPEHAFSVIVGDRQYSLRSLPGDMQHLFSNPRSYIYHRLSPGVSSAMESLTSKDNFGRPVGWTQQVIDLLMQPIPIPLQKAGETVLHDELGTKAVRYDMRDLFASTIGLSTAFYKNENEIRKWITSWKEGSGNPKLISEVERGQSSIFPPSMYNDLRDALNNGDMETAQNAYKKLVQMQGGDAKAVTNIRRQMHNWANAPFTGSKKNEAAFKRSLDQRQLAVYQKARDERRNVYRNFMQLKRGQIPLLRAAQDEGDNLDAFLEQ